MQKNHYIDSVIQYIEERLSGELNPEYIAKRYFISLSQLYRDFYSYTGHAVKEYIRKRRLSNALALVKASGIPFADIAYEWGYSSQQSFCRTLKQTLGMTPLEYRNNDIYYLFPPFKGDSLQAETEMFSPKNLTENDNTRSM